MKKRVMIVDDSCVMEMQIQRLLEGSEFEVAAYCDSGEDAIRRYGEIRPDVVTMDIIMPGLDGLETAQVILREHPDARIVMISSLAYGDTFDEATAIGIRQFLHKPFDREDLLTALAGACCTPCPGR